MKDDALRNRHQRSVSDGGHGPLKSKLEVQPATRAHAHGLPHVFRFFLVHHVLAILTIGVTSGVLMWLIENSATASLWSMVFAGISAVTCTGLFTTPTVGWKSATTAVWYLATAMGSPVLTSIAVPWVRQRVVARHRKSQSHTSRRDARLIRVLIAYAVFWYSVGTVVLSRIMPWYDALGRTVGAFSNAGWTDPVPRTVLDDVPSLIAMAFVVPFGCTLFPLGLRVALWLDEEVFSHRMTARRRSTADENSTEAIELVTGSNLPANYGTVTAARTMERHVSASSSLLALRNPNPHHPSLFNLRETWSIAIAWCAIWLAVFSVLVLDPRSLSVVASTDAARTWIAASQASVLRFSGLTLVDLLVCSTAQLCFLGAALYLPVWVVFSSRKDKQWNCWLECCGPCAKAVATRGGWLIAATIAILALEEASSEVLHRQPLDVSRGLALKVFFEVISAYATTGVTLGGTGGASLSASFSLPSQLVIAVVMLAGRHRNMDLGLDAAALEEHHPALELPPPREPHHHDREAHKGPINALHRLLHRVQELWE